MNIEYEVDELRRDMKIPELASQGIECTFIHNKVLVEPETVCCKCVSSDAWRDRSRT